MLWDVDHDCSSIIDDRVHEPGVRAGSDDRLGGQP
jgi:hypothetical protein